MFDAHNHLQDPRLSENLESIFTTCHRAGIERMVVNGTCEEDWSKVLNLAQAHTSVVPSFGYHPWKLNQRSEAWQTRFTDALDSIPSAVGEIGLDRWMPQFDLPLQEEAFVFQLRVAAERNLPLTIHCLTAWGKLVEILEREPLPACGFLLHSYSGPAEMIPRFARLGAYFSLSGYFAHERKQKQLAGFRLVPRDRLLIETDAPDMAAPPELQKYSVMNGNDQLNHPANLSGVYRLGAELLEEPLDDFSARVGQNFRELFGSVLGRIDAQENCE
jgi:TatD DNase family protein